MKETWKEHKGFKDESPRPMYIQFPDWWYKEHNLEPVELWTLKNIKLEVIGKSNLPTYTHDELDQEIAQDTMKGT